MQSRARGGDDLRTTTMMAACTASASLPARSTTVSTADAPTAAETVTPAAETAGLAHLQPVPPPSKPPPSLPPSLPDTDGDEGSESEGAEGSNAASVVEARRAARCAEIMNEAVEEGDYHLNNEGMKIVVKDALELQGYSMDQEPRGNKVKLSEVQAFVFEALGVEADKKELRPIVEEMLEALAFARDEAAAEKRGQQLTLEYIHREHGSHIRRRNQPAWMTPRTSPFDGVTPITKHNAWRYEHAKPKLTECRATRSASSCRTADSEPGRFYRQVMGKEWDGENHSFDLASKKFRRLLPDNRRDEQEREQRRQRHKGRRTQGKGIAKAARPSSTTLNATGGAAVSPPPAQPTSGATGSSLAKESVSSSVADKPRATGSATSSAPASSSVVLTAAAKPQRDDERFGGDYKAYRRADRAWHEQRRRDRLKSSAPYDLPRREPSNGRSARAAKQPAVPRTVTATATVDCVTTVEDPPPGAPATGHPPSSLPCDVEPVARSAPSASISESACRLPSNSCRTAAAADSPVPSSQPTPKSLGALPLPDPFRLLPPVLRKPRAAGHEQRRAIEAAELAERLATEREVAATAHLEEWLVQEWERVSQELQQVREAQLQQWREAQLSQLRPRIRIVTDDEETPSEMLVCAGEDHSEDEAVQPAPSLAARCAGSTEAGSKHC